MLPIALERSVYGLITTPVLHVALWHIATAVMNLEMQLETRGRHRTPAEYCELLTGAGFVDPEVRRSARDKHLVIGRKRSG